MVRSFHDPCLRCGLVTVLRWFDGLVVGSAVQCETAGALILDFWFEMLALSRPIPRTVACALDPPPSFHLSLAGFGPASHVAICSAPRMIRFVSAFIPATSGVSFLKMTAEIWLEHAQAQVRRTIMDFRVAAKIRKQWATNVLQRSLEGTLVNLAGESSDNADTVKVQPNSSSDSDTSRAAAADRPRKRVRAAAPQNRAYRSCELSSMIPLSVFAPAFETEEWRTLCACMPLVSVP